jgi:HK97 family phage prohead protease
MKPSDFLAPLEVKLADSGEITGYGSTFGNIDRGGDIVAPGAFGNSLAEHKAEGTAPAMLWHHDLAEPIGVWTEASEDSKGLLLKGKLTVGTKRGAEARALAKDGALAMSIGYRAKDADYQNGARILKELELVEVSLVSIPMNPEARIVSVKSAAAAEIRTAIQFERFLKQHGFANSLARRLAAGWNAALGRDDEDAAALLRAIKARTEALSHRS